MADKTRAPDDLAERTPATQEEKSLHLPVRFRPADALAVIATGFLIAVFVVLHRSELLHSGRQFSRALGVTLAFALLAWRIGGVNTSGALAGAAIAFIMAARDLRIFLLLLLVFVITFAATALGRARKQHLKAAERSDGRSASQVLANLGIAALVLTAGPEAWTVMALAALAEAAADTTSSEIGLAFPGKTVLITTWREVSPGIDGGISLRGTAAAVFASGVVALCSLALTLVSTGGAVVIACSGILGTIIDSLLGALLERKRLLNNDLVNLLSTAAAALSAYWLM